MFKTSFQAYTVEYYKSTLSIDALLGRRHGLSLGNRTDKHSYLFRQQRCPSLKTHRIRGQTKHEQFMDPIALPIYSQCT